MTLVDVVAGFSKVDPSEMLRLHESLTAPLYDGQFLEDVSHSILADEYIRALRTDPDVAVCTDGQGGLFVCRALPWDTSYFGLGVCRVEYGVFPTPADQIGRMIDWLGSEEYGLCYLRLPADCVGRAVVAGLDPLALMSTKMLMRQPTAPATGVAELVTLDCVPQADRDALIERAARVAGERFTVGRFHSDARVGSARASELYSRWVREVATRRPGDVFCLLDASGFAAGLLICRTLTVKGQPFALAELVLSFTVGAGVGMLLIEAVKDRLHRTGYPVWFANADITNRSALKLYVRAGFVPFHAVDEYHAWIDWANRGRRG